MKMKGVDPKIIAVIIVMIAIVLFSVAVATGALKPVGDLLSAAKITDILSIFGIRS